MYQVEDLRTEQRDNIHATRLKFYLDDAIDTKAIMSHVLQPKFGMPVARLMCLEEISKILQVHIRQKRLEHLED